MLREALFILVMLSSFPVGYLLAYLCREELVAGRKWFKLIAVISIVLIFVFMLLIQVDNWLAIVLTLVYLAIISLVGLKLSYRKGFAKS